MAAAAFNVADGGSHIDTAPAARQLRNVTAKGPS
jgi:hypothetical protein